MYICVKQLKYYESNFCVRPLIVLSCILDTLANILSYVILL